MKKLIQKWNNEIDETDIVSRINGILTSCHKLPFDRQVETINKLIEQMKESKKEAEAMALEIGNAIDEIKL